MEHGINHGKIYMDTQGWVLNGFFIDGLQAYAIKNLYLIANWYGLTLGSPPLLLLFVLNSL